MKPFRFSLEPIRALKQQAEQSARERYAATLRACEEAAAAVQKASVELTEGWTGLCQRLAAGVSGVDLLRARAWCNVLELRVKERAAVLEKARFAVDAMWKELMIATNEREGMDRLYKRRRAFYQREVQVAEQKALDELALQLIQPTSFTRGLTTPGGH